VYTSAPIRSWDVVSLRPDRRTKKKGTKKRRKGDEEKIEKGEVEKGEHQKKATGNFSLLALGE
jgi:hypothetical protein